MSDFISVSQAPIHAGRRKTPEFYLQKTRNPPTVQILAQRIDTHMYQYFTSNGTGITIRRIYITLYMC